MSTVAPLVEREVNCCSFLQSKDLPGFTDDLPREHEIEQFLRQIASRGGATVFDRSGQAV
jgi:hypothetical protein